jgi:hypothetical protein
VWSAGVVWLGFAAWEGDMRILFVFGIMCCWERGLTMDSREKVEKRLRIIIHDMGQSRDVIDKTTLSLDRGSKFTRTMSFDNCGRSPKPHSV